MKDSTRKAVLSVLIGIIVVCVVVIAVTLIKHKRNNKIYEDLAQEEINAENSEEDTEDSTEADTLAESEETSTELSTEEQEDYECPIDFDKLENINPDVYAWVEIEGTKLAYPVLQSSAEDDYYLDVTIEGNHGLPGSIYTQKTYNSKDFEDFNTILYGHNMRDGSMFGVLKHYREDKDYVKEHPEVKIYLPDKELTYTVAAAIVYGNELIPYRYDFDTELGKQLFIDSIYDNKDSRSIIFAKDKITTDDKLLTLSTCINNEHDRRFLVICVLNK